MAYYIKEHYREVVYIKCETNSQLAKKDIDSQTLIRYYINDDFQELKLFDRKELSDDEIKKLNSLKGRIQASRNIEEGKFPEINRLTNLIG